MRPRSLVYHLCALAPLLIAACQGDDGGGDASLSDGTSSTATSAESSGDTSTGADTSTDATTTATTTSTDSDATDSGGDPLLDALLAIDGLSVDELEPLLPGTRLFALTYLQPADHDDLGGAWFGQRMTLFHRESAAPTVLATSGYHLMNRAYLTEPTILLEANQLAVEQRFFGPSRPDPADWSHLTIAQAAADHHRIIEALRPIYAGAWAETGASKGGMTSVYHRRFYPDDVDATIAYVAPHSLAAEDPRYEPYIDEIGDPGCAQALRDLQAEALGRREALEAMAADVAEADGLTFDHIGLARALEFEVVESRFTFWQYGGAAGCATIPTSESSDAEIFAWLEEVVGLAYFADDTLDHYGPYFYQAASELGAPRISEDHLGDLRLFPGEDTAALFSPPGLTVSYDPTAMAAVSTWLQGSGERLVFVYGGRDPWTAGAFELGGAIDSRAYVVADGNHGTKLADLDDAAFDEVMADLFGWLGAAPPAPGELAGRRANAPAWPRLGRGR